MSNRSLPIRRRLFNATLLAGAGLLLDAGAASRSRAQSPTPQSQAPGARALKLGIIMTQNGPNAADGKLQLDGALLAIEEANAKGGPAGHRITPVVLDDYTTTAGDFDPAQAARDARELAEDPDVVAVVGPKTSDSAKAIEAILNRADLATIGPSGTNPDLTDPKLANIYRPSGRTTYFRTVTTDAYQAPGMANFLAEKLNVTSAFVLDDGTSFGVGVAESFRKQAAVRGIKVLGADRVNPREADYMTVLTKVKALAPQALYFTGDVQAGIKVAKQSYDVVPKMIKAGTDALLGGSFLTATGFPAANGWYVTVAAPHVLEDAAARDWIDRFVKRFGVQPFDYSITAFDAAAVALDAIGRVAASGKAIDRHSVRDAIQATHLSTLQGLIAFDGNGDLSTTAVSTFQVQHNPAYADGDPLRQFKYIGLAPES
ncbi:MAG: branched-chain amino acid ABC transporter substrate-binding protein [Acidisphaera sp.]|nr:branched-chain amino acid ABC transporter substrate-binding protein [Acidisphaera sp.]